MIDNNRLTEKVFEKSSQVRQYSIAAASVCEWMHYKTRKHNESYAWIKTD